MSQNSVLVSERIKDKVLPWILYGILLAIGLMTFFCVVHPLYIYDTDDWSYIAFSRHALPGTSNWNPTKILPETLMPLMAELGIRLIMPFTDDYIGSMAFAFAVILVMFILLYIVSFGRILEKKFCLKRSIVWLITTIFVLYHFLPFSVNEIENKHMFYGGSVNCTFNYLIPGLLNAAVIMYLMVNPQKKWKNIDSYVGKGFLILALYLCINSNMFHSIILISFVGTNLLVDVVKDIVNKENKKFKQLFIGWLQNNTFEIAIIIIWLISLIFEINGGRAKWAAETGLFNLPIKETVGIFVKSICSMNRLYLFSILVIVFCALGVCLFQSKKKKKEIDCLYIESLGKSIISLGITVVYLLLLCAKVSPLYIENNLVMISWMVWYMLIGFMSLAYLLVKMPRITLLLPLLLYIVVFETVIDGRTFAENNVAGFEADVVKELDNQLIEQIIAADDAGLDCVNVYIPVHSADTWPMNVSYGGNRISQTLFMHGVVDRKINVTLVMDQNINDRYKLR